MHDARGWAALRVLIAAATVGAWAPPRAEGSPTHADITYRTTGSVGSPGDGAGSPVTFHGVDNGWSASSTPFNLGEFEVAFPQLGSAARDVNMPFAITYTTRTVDGIVPSVNGSPVVLQGQIVGSLDGVGQSHLRAIFPQNAPSMDPTSPYNPNLTTPFQTANLIATMSVNNLSALLPLTTSGGYRTPVGARIEVAPVPEPTAMAVFAVAVVGLGLRRWNRSTR